MTQRQPPFCWYRLNRRCNRPTDCRMADYCMDCFNPAEREAMRAGPLWMHDVRDRVGDGESSEKEK